MLDTLTGQKNITGLSYQRVRDQQAIYGKNIFEPARGSRFLHLAKDIVTEPMFILLAMACSLYFFLGNIAEGFMMAIAIVFVSAISFYQEMKSSRALHSLQELTEPKVKVIREGHQEVIITEELVPGDIMLLEEGMKIPADAIVIQSNDLSVDESPLTGESLPVQKSNREESNQLYQGSTINSGQCTAEVTVTGSRTVLGKIGKAVSGYQENKTLLQKQLNSFVKKFALFGFVAFGIIFSINYYHYSSFTTSLLFALTLAMSVLPEEIPVAFSSFMALGAYKMSKLGIISRQPQTIENLGVVTVLCLDKTGTITENRMQLKSMYAYRRDAETELNAETDESEKRLLFFARLASEKNPFDPMEKAIVEANEKFGQKNSSYDMVHEYPLEGIPPMMTHVFEWDGQVIAAGKGAAERIMRVCNLNEIETAKVTEYVQKFSEKGYRVLGVASAQSSDTVYPGNQDDFAWQFEGLVALYDPPRQGVSEVVKQIAAAGIKIKLITGDHTGTAINIARQVGMVIETKVLTGDAVVKMSDEDLQALVGYTNIFARMFPDAKARVIRALKLNGEIVAMTGDGVNDGPALKLADIGIAMGKRGTETARQSADLILTYDKLDRITIAVSEGRKIFNNLRKAIRYIISIHIPIILTASIPVILGWKYPNIFTPIHVIFLELIMGPTCSIFFEREPVEQLTMLTNPRSSRAGLFSLYELKISIVQGLVITGGVLFLYFQFMSHHTIEVTRAVVFNTLIFSNIFLTFADRSFNQTVLKTSLYKNNLAPWILLISGGFLVLLNFVPFIQRLFQVSPLTMKQFLIAMLVSFVTVMWFEVYKYLRKR